MLKGATACPSCEQAVVLLKTAAEKEMPARAMRLAAMYATGNCVSRNRVEAYRWVSSALATNFPIASGAAEPRSPLAADDSGGACGGGKLSLQQVTPGKGSIRRF